MKFRKIYICSNCGAKYLKWQGQCDECGSWNSLVEDVEKEEVKKKEKKAIVEFSSRRYLLKDISTKPLEKINTGIDEFDRVLTGGVIKGQVVLVGGIPGIGKSTLMMEIAGSFASKGFLVLYISGEESPHQLSQRADRLGIRNDKIIVESITDISEIIKEIDEIKPDIVIVDSIQTIYHPEFGSSPSSPLQIRECSWEFVKLAKSRDIIFFLLGQVTKEGEFAGPKLLEHIVDTVLYFENDKTGGYRILRSFKNRFGNIDEIGIFEMTEKGLISSNNYIDRLVKENNMPGKAYSVSYEGSRSIIISVEALVNRSFYPYPKRVFSLIDSNYAQILLASIEKNTPLRFDNYDVYLNLNSGFKTKDRGIDLAIIASVISSLKDISLPQSTVFIGEVGMLGQIYSAIAMQKKILEVERAGFKRVVISSGVRDLLNTSLEIIKINNIAMLYKFLVG